MTAFYVLGGVLAAWALIVTALGITRPGFPGSRGAERLVIAISALLVAGAIGSGIVTAASEDEEEDEAVAAEAAPAAEEQGGAPALAIRADPEGGLAFDADALEAPAGTVTIEMENPSPVPHNVAIEGDGVEAEGEVVGQGEVSRASAELQPGEYTFFCSVPGHRQGGMEGTLTISG